MSKENKFIICYITTANTDEAKRISETLIKEKLAACTNIIDNMSSFFMWKGKLENSKEVILLAKTRASLFKNIVETVKTQQPSYETPCILALPIIDGSEDFLQWVEDETIIEI